MKLQKNFYQDDSMKVAKNLLGKVLFHRSGEGLTNGIIVETEAYFGIDDPASRASETKTKINETMWADAGTSLVYMVHGHWLFNVISEEEGEPGGVLIRAIEPLEGLDIMKKRRGTDSVKELTSGPGKLTEAMGITRDHHCLFLPDCERISIENSKVDDIEIGSSHRIGVTEDLEQELRFFVKDNDFVSR